MTSPNRNYTNLQSDITYHEVNPVKISQTPTKFSIRFNFAVEFIVRPGTGWASQCPAAVLCLTKVGATDVDAMEKIRTALPDAW